MDSLNSFQEFAVLIQSYQQLYSVCMYVLLQLIMVSIPLELWSLYTPYLCSISVLPIIPQKRAIILDQYTDIPSHGGCLVLNRILHRYLAYLQLGFEAHLQMDGRDADMRGLGEAICYECDMVGFTTG